MAQPLSPGTLSAAVDPLNGGVLSSGMLFDVWYDPTADKVALIYRNAANETKMRVNNGSDGITCSWGSITLAHGSAIGVSVTILVNSGVYYAVGAYVLGGAFVYGTGVKMDGTAQNDTTLGTPPTNTTGRVAIMASPFAATKAFVFYDALNISSTTWPTDIQVIECDYLARVVTALARFAQQVTLYARPQAYYSAAGTADICVPVMLMSRIQSTIFLLKFSYAVGNVGALNSPVVLARILPGECGNLGDYYLAGATRMPTCLGTAGAAVRLPFLKAGRPTFGSFSTSNQIALATMTTALSLPTLNAQRSLFMTGGCPQSYDGVHAHEAGFNYFPEGVTAVAAAGGACTAGAYGCVVVYRWQDAKGVLHRSNTSVPISTAAALNNKLTYTIPPLRLTTKQSVPGAYDDRDVEAEVYLTIHDGTIYYKAGVVSQYAWADAALTFEYTGSDATLQANELLYTTGGGLENEAFPSTSIVCQHQNRLFFVIQEEQDWIQYTDEIDERFLAPATNEAYRLRVPSEGGKVVAMGSMDSKLIVICENQIYAYFGEGPNRLGQQNGYSLGQIVSGSLGGLAGCQEAVVLAPEGLWFMSSENGLRLLSRGLSIQMDPNDPDAFLGQEVDSLFDTSPYSSIQAQVIPSKSQIRWYLGGLSTVVVWNYEQHQFYKFTNHNSNGGTTVAAGVFWHSDGTNLFSTNSAAGGLDDATYTDMVLETAWIKLADAQGFQRVYSFMLLAQSISTSYVTLAVGYDYSDTYIASSIASEALGVVATTLDYNTGVGTPFILGATITGGTSGATGTVVRTTDTAGIGQIVLTGVSGTFQAAENLTTTGASAVCVTVTKSLVMTASSVAAGNLVVGQASGATGVVSSVLDLTTGSADKVALLNTVVGTFGVLDIITVRRVSTYTATGANNPLQIEHPMPLQQCEAVRFKITISPGSAAEAIRLTNFALSIGMKRGLFKLPSAQRF